MVGVQDTLIYSTGAPHPGDVDLIFQALLNKDYTSCFSYVRAKKIDRGVALADLIGVLFELVQKIELPAKAR